MMKDFVVSAYRWARQVLNSWMEHVCLSQGIEKFGDHFVYTGCLNQSSIIVDLGANIGTFSKAVFDKYGGKILLIEPNASLLESIFIPDAIKINSAILSGKKTALFYFTRNSEAGSLDREMATPFGVIDEKLVTCISFDHLVRENSIGKIDLLKVDIEGGEIDLLKNSQELLRCSQIVVEFHDFLDLRQKDLVKEVTSRLVGLGFSKLRFSALDNRQVLFIQHGIRRTSVVLFMEFKLISLLSFWLDSIYYRGLVRLSKVWKLQV